MKLNVTLETVREAAMYWANQFDALDCGIIKRLMTADPDGWREVTVPRELNKVYVFEAPDGCETGEGEIVSRDDENEDYYNVQMDGTGTIQSVCKDCFKVQRDSILPMWGKMWSFSDYFDKEWIERPSSIRAMSEAGFRIYESDEFGYFFGIDGGGYDFYEKHWIPLYKARGLHWHERDDDE